MLQAEVNALCGAKYDREASGEARRAGSAKCYAFINGTREEIERPRVRDEQGEVNLKSYAVAKDQGLFFDQIVEAIAAGLPVRGVEDCHGGAVKKTQASEMWVRHSAEVFEQFRSRSLSESDWVAIQIDGVFLKNHCIVVAIGITTEGEKKALDFEIGASESFETSKLLCERLAERGFGPGSERDLLVVRDGSKALAKAVRAVWPRARQQECLVHAEREIIDKLPKAAREEAIRLFKRLRLAEGKVAGEEAFEALVGYLKKRNKHAADCLAARKDSLLVFHRLDVSSSLNSTFTNTNHVENLIRNWRQETGRVKSWDMKGDQLSRWTAVGLSEAEKGFRRIRGYQDLDELVEALRVIAADSTPAESAEADSASVPPAAKESALSSCVSTDEP